MKWFFRIFSFWNHFSDVLWDMNRLYVVYFFCWSHFDLCSKHPKNWLKKNKTFKKIFTWRPAITSYNHFSLRFTKIRARMKPNFYSRNFTWENFLPYALKNLRLKKIYISSPVKKTKYLSKFSKINFITVIWTCCVKNSELDDKKRFLCQGLSGLTTASVQGSIVHGTPTQQAATPLDLSPMRHHRSPATTPVSYSPSNSPALDMIQEEHPVDVQKVTE